MQEVQLLNLDRQYLMTLKEHFVIFCKSNLAENKNSVLYKFNEFVLKDRPIRSRSKQIG